MPFTKSDIGAQSAWKGYSSQTLYIASRIMGETANDEYYPEHLEDLLIKRDGQVVEAVQVKNLSDPLTISDLALTKESRSGEYAVYVIPNLCFKHCALCILGNWGRSYRNFQSEIFPPKTKSKIS